MSCMFSLGEGPENWQIKCLSRQSTPEEGGLGSQNIFVYIFMVGNFVCSLFSVVGCVYIWNVFHILLSIVCPVPLFTFYTIGSYLILVYSWNQGVPFDSIPRREKPRRVDLYYSSWFIQAGNGEDFFLCILSLKDRYVAFCNLSLKELPFFFSFD